MALPDLRFNRFEIDIGSWEEDTGEAKNFAGNLTELNLAIR